MAQSQQCGNAANPYSILRPAQNQVIANNDLNTVIFIHRQNPALHGETSAESGKYRYSISVDGGLSFTQNVGPLNPTYTRPTRYPNAVLYNPPGNTDPESAYMVWAGPILMPSGTGWDGHSNGVTQVSLTNPTGSENYQFQSSFAGLPGGLTERIPGEFWMVENPIKNDSNYSDTLYVYKGAYDLVNNTVSWTRAFRMPIPVNKTYDGVGRAYSPNIAFSPNGQIGYIGLIGDLIGGTDSVYNPIYIKTIDGGQTWGTPTEINVNTTPGILDSLQAFLFDDGNGGTIIVSSACTAFDYDISVDANGNLHYFTVICAGETQNTSDNSFFTDKQYSVYSGFPKFACDITTTDGGNTWTGTYMAPVNTFRTTIGTLTIDNQPQASRNETGTHMFFSWVDTDTLIAGVSNNNINPNLRVVGSRISDKYQTCYKRVENVTIDDQVYASTMAPSVLSDDGHYKMAVVATEIISDENSPVRFHYLGNQTSLCEADFKDPATLDFTWSFSGGCYNEVFCADIASIEPAVQGSALTIFPNPTADKATISLKDLKGKVTYITVTDLSGKVVMNINGSAITEGQEQYILDVARLSSGVYNVNVVMENNMISHKLNVVK